MAFLLMLSIFLVVSQQEPFIAASSVFFDASNDTRHAATAVEFVAAVRDTSVRYIFVETCDLVLGPELWMLGNDFACTSTEQGQGVSLIKGAPVPQLLDYNLTIAASPNISNYCRPFLDFNYTAGIFLLAFPNVLNFTGLEMYQVDTAGPAGLAVVPKPGSGQLPGLIVLQDVFLHFEIGIPAKTSIAFYNTVDRPVFITGNQIYTPLNDTWCGARTITPNITNPSSNGGPPFSQFNSSAINSIVVTAPPSNDTTTIPSHAPTRILLQTSDNAIGSAPVQSSGTNSGSTETDTMMTRRWHTRGACPEYAGYFTDVAMQVPFKPSGLGGYYVRFMNSVMFTDELVSKDCLGTMTVKECTVLMLLARWKRYGITRVPFDSQPPKVPKGAAVNAPTTALPEEAEEPVTKWAWLAPVLGVSIIVILAIMSAAALAYLATYAPHVLPAKLRTIMGHQKNGQRPAPGDGDPLRLARTSMDRLLERVPLGLTLGQMLGAGSYGRVYQALWKGQEVAVKVLRHHRPREAVAVNRELDVSSGLDHPHVVKTHCHTKVSVNKADEQKQQQTLKRKSSAQGLDGKGKEVLRKDALKVSTAPASNSTFTDSTVSFNQGSSTSGGSSSQDTSVYGSSVGSSTASSATATPRGSEPGYGNIGSSNHGLTPLLVRDSLAQQGHEVTRVQAVDSKACNTAVCDRKHTIATYTPPALGTTASIENSRADQKGVVLVSIAEIATSAAQPDKNSSIKTPQHAQQQQRTLASTGSDDHGRQLLPTDSLPSHTALLADGVAATGNADVDVGAGQNKLGSVDDACVGVPAGTMGLDLTETWIVMELCPGGSLAAHVSAGGTVKTGTNHPDMAAVLRYAWEVADGMEYLHRKGVIHGDLKCENVLLGMYHSGTDINISSSHDHKDSTAPHTLTMAPEDFSFSFHLGQHNRTTAAAAAAHVKLDVENDEDSTGLGGVWSCKVCDFGLSRLLDTGRTHLSTRAFGTVTHCPPELIMTGQLRPAADVYAFAMILYEMVTSRKPFKGLGYGEIVQRVVVGNTRPDLSADLDPTFVALINDCWAQQPQARPDFTTIKTRLQSLMKHT